MEYSFRVCGKEDFPFVLRLHHTTLREYIEPIYGWDEAKWDGFVGAWFKPEKIQIIQQDGRDIGLLVLEERPKEFFLESISIVPPLQRKGLGSKIIADIIGSTNKPIALQVLKSNLAAKALYLRFGFMVTEETETDFHMRRG